MIGVSACASSEVKKGSREDIEQQLDEMKKVYPTKNVEDLFEIFPDGFEIEQTVSTGEEFKVLHLEGDAETKELKGYLDIDDRRILVNYNNDKLMSTEESNLSQFWPYKGFIFEFYGIDREKLSKLEMQKKSYTYENGDFSIEYYAQNNLFNNYLQFATDKKLILKFPGAKAKLVPGYHHALYVEYETFRYTELVSEYITTP
ncbi:hypothetical protein AB1395_03780 [Streptococcus pluranimalium]|uniref:hypothetical protein n=1 Tax=Streptococcus pluranimalium TaxID=82348 RepID=UPI003466A4B0